VPAHFFPAAINDHLGTVSVIDHVMAHPLGEGDVSVEKFVRVTALSEPLDLFGGRDIQEAHMDAVEIGCAGCGEEFSRRDGIAAQEEIHSGLLFLQGELDHLLDGLMTPAEGPLGSEAESGELANGDAPGERWFEQLADRALANATCAGDEEKHRSASLHRVEGLHQDLFAFEELLVAED